MKMNNSTIIMNFSRIYEQEKFYKNEEITWIEVKDISGTNCYCDDDAIKQIQEKIRELPIEGIHFIDSGNYHYMSRIWIEKIKEPFRLLVFDNHTDMQMPAFGGILSCGGWIMAALEEIPLLKEVILIGPDEEAYLQVDDVKKSGKVRFLSREELLNSDKDVIVHFFQEIPVDLPLYISVDKDVLNTGDACTTWSQGDMRLEELIEYLTIVADLNMRMGQRIIGMDICGECDVEQTAKNDLNDIANRKLLQWYNENLL